jgi:hypothetical protein
VRDMWTARPAAFGRRISVLLHQRACETGKNEGG